MDGGRDGRRFLSLSCSAARAIGIWATACVALGSPREGGGDGQPWTTIQRPAPGTGKWGSGADAGHAIADLRMKNRSSSSLDSKPVVTAVAVSQPVHSTLVERLEYLVSGQRCV